MYSQAHQRHDRDRPAQVEGSPPRPQHLLGIPDVGRHVGGGPLGRAGRAAPGRRRARSGRCLRTRSGSPGDTPGRPGGCSARSAGRCPGQETAGFRPPWPGRRTARPRKARLARAAGQDGRVGRDHLLRGLQVGGEVVPPAEPVVVHPGGMGHARVERDSFGGRVADLSHELPSLSAAASAARNRNRCAPVERNAAAPPHSARTTTIISPNGLGIRPAKQLPAPGVALPAALHVPTTWGSRSYTADAARVYPEDLVPQGQGDLQFAELADHQLESALSVRPGKRPGTSGLGIALTAWRS